MGVAEVAQRVTFRAPLFHAAGGAELALQPRDALPWMESQCTDVNHGIHKCDHLTRGGFVTARGEPRVCGLDLRPFAVKQGEGIHWLASQVEVVGLRPDANVVRSMGEVQRVGGNIGELRAGVVGGDFMDFEALSAIAL